jgi:hypothetical protein
VKKKIKLNFKRWAQRLYLYNRDTRAETTKHGKIWEKRDIAKTFLDVELEIKCGVGRARRTYGVQLDFAFLIEARLLEASKDKVITSLLRHAIQTLHLGTRWMSAVNLKRQQLFSRESTAPCTSNRRWVCLQTVWTRCRREKFLSLPRT